MSKRCIVNVATGPHYIKGQDRLLASEFVDSAEVACWRDNLPIGSPEHEHVPYAFKAHALAAQVKAGFATMVWFDASIVPIRSLGLMWEKIERDGYWIAQNNRRRSNWHWTAKDAYDDLEITEEENRAVQHVVSGAFGFNVDSYIGGLIFDNFYRLARTKAFCGPWKNDNLQAHPDPEVLGHRHDQTALSVIAHRLELTLTHSPEIFAYTGFQTDQTIVIADGGY